MKASPSGAELNYRVWTFPLPIVVSAWGAETTVRTQAMWDGYVTRFMVESRHAPYYLVTEVRAADRLWLVGPVSALLFSDLGQARASPMGFRAGELLSVTFKLGERPKNFRDRLGRFSREPPELRSTFICRRVER